MIECPRCGATHEDGAYRCGECGKDLVDVDGDGGDQGSAPFPIADGGTHCVDGTDRSSTFSAFPYIGSKTYLAPWIVDHLRAHDNFVVPFGGAAGVIINKPRSGCEIYNDRDEDLVEFFRACREHPEELAERVRNIPFSRSLYDEWSQQFRSGDGWPDELVERAARWVYLRYASFSGRYGQRAGFATDTPRGGPQKSRIWQQMPERIWTIRDRFRGVAIECLDYSDILGRYDDKEVETLYYCDPPYTEAKSDYYRGPDFDHGRFVDELADVDAHWVVSYSEPPAGLEDLATTVVERTYNRSAGEENEDRAERLFLSYEPHTVPMFVDGSTSQQTLLAATDGGNDCNVQPDTEQEGDEPVTDGGRRRPYVADCQDCAWQATYDGSQWKLPDEQAKIAGGGHKSSNPGHEIDVYPEPVDELYYAATTTAHQRVFHITDDCRELAKVDTVTDCPATHPPRGTVCNVCAPGLTVEDVQAEPAIADGGKPGGDRR